MTTISSGGDCDHCDVVIDLVTSEKFLDQIDDYQLLVNASTAQNFCNLKKMIFFWSV